MSKYGMAMILSVSSLSLFAQGTTEKVTVTTPGTLMELVSDLESSRIYSLKVEGALNAADLSYIGGESGKIKTVKELDLSDITLISGPEPYKKYALRDNENGLLGNTTATFFISDTARIESKVVDIALGGQSTLQSVYGKNLAGLFAGCGYEKVVLPTIMTSLGYASFFGAYGIKEVIFPSSVQEIEPDAFYSVSTLTQVNLPNNLKKIGDNSFSKTGLTEISLPESLDSICGRAFKETPLYTIDLQNVKYVGPECFYECKLEGMLDVSNLVVIAEKSFSRNVISGIIFGSNLTQIDSRAFYRNENLISIALPEGLKIIGEEAFDSCLRLENVDIPTTVEYIGYNAFDNTPWNSNLKGDNGVVYIGSIAYAYDHDSAADLSVLEFREGTTTISNNFKIDSNYKDEITSIVFPSTLKKIEGGHYRDVFGRMAKLGDIAFNEGLEYIGDYTFSGCKKMWFDKFPSTLKYIGDYAFEECNELTEITIPESIEYIGNYAFSYCKGLSDVKYLANPSFAGTNIFTCTEGLYKVTFGKAVQNIPQHMFYLSGVKKIVFETPQERDYPVSLGNSCFYNAKKIEKIELPSVDILSKWSFFGCEQLESIIIDGNCNIIEEDCASGAPIADVRINGKVGKISDYAFNY
ncbi:MAG: leucine-rich repeat domain-containing protein, partial [Muribaculaceae bacterium]|nr:leucine-rich repeat domain-containing protein [Muribaculaceae bacterium]